jgi:hypothetical protein
MTLLGTYHGAFDIWYIDLDQDRFQWKSLVNSLMNSPVPQNIGKFLNSCTSGISYKSAQLHQV